MKAVEIIAEQYPPSQRFNIYTYGNIKDWSQRLLLFVPVGKFLANFDGEVWGNKIASERIHDIASEQYVVNSQATIMTVANLSPSNELDVIACQKNLTVLLFFSGSQPIVLYMKKWKFTGWLRLAHTWNNPTHPFLSQRSIKSHYSMRFQESIENEPTGKC